MVSFSTSVFSTLRPKKARHSKLVRTALITTSTSAKSHGPEFLSDGDIETYWQSEGPLPHRINMRFSRGIYVNRVSVRVMFAKDDSYAPMEIEMHAGTCSHDLCKITDEIAFQKTGIIDLCVSGDSRRVGPFFEVELIVTGNNEGGRDTRIREIEIYGERICDMHKITHFRSIL